MQFHLSCPRTSRVSSVYLSWITLLEKCQQAQLDAWMVSHIIPPCKVVQRICSSVVGVCLPPPVPGESLRSGTAFPVLLTSLPFLSFHRAYNGEAPSRQGGSIPEKVQLRTSYLNAKAPVDTPMTRSSPRGLRPVWLLTAPYVEEPMLPLMLCCCHLEILSSP